jgi:hypothetical protein
MLALKKLPAKANSDAINSTENLRHVGQFRGSAGSSDGWGTLTISTDESTCWLYSPSFVSFHVKRLLVGVVGALRMMTAVPGGLASWTSALLREKAKRHADMVMAIVCSRQNTEGGFSLRIR